MARYSLSFLTSPHRSVDVSCSTSLFHLIIMYFQTRRRFAGATPCIPSATITKQEYHLQTQGLLGNS